MVVVPVLVRIVHSRGLEEEARRVATAFRHPRVEVRVEEKSWADGVLIVGPGFATRDVTTATAIIRRWLLSEGA